jgi:hypothetical protein
MLDVTRRVERGGKAVEVEVYPVRVNPIPNIVEKHATFLFGQVAEDDRPLVFPRLVPKDKKDKEVAKETEQVLLDIWSQSNGRAIQLDAATHSQVYGGCVFRLDYTPDDPFKDIPISVQEIHPKVFVGIPDASDYFNLREAWIVTPINRFQAFEDYNVTVDPDTTEIWLIEQYTRRTYHAWVNQYPAERLISGNWMSPPEEHGWGFVPIVYIPHVRSTGFYGENVFDAIIGLVKEYNLRIADFGDAVTTDAHSYLAMRNVVGSPTVVQLAQGLYAVNLPGSPNYTGQEAQPDLYNPGKVSASAQMESLVRIILEQIRRDARVPAVLDGEDEGSQRSGLTLALRAISLVAHVEVERIYWNTGLNVLTKMMLRMLSLKGIIKNANFRVKHNWYPVLPRDREMTVTEAISRMGAKLGSPELLLELLGDVQDVDEEVDRIIKFWVKLEKALAQAASKPVAQKSPQEGSEKEGKDAANQMASSPIEKSTEKE